MSSGPAVFTSPVADPSVIEAIKALVRDQQLRVAASTNPPSRPDRGFHRNTIGTGEGELRFGDIPEQLQEYFPFRSQDVVRADVRFSYGSERPKQDDGKGMLGLSLRLYVSGQYSWNLTQLSSPVFLKNAREVLLTLQAAKVAAETFSSRSELLRSLAVAVHILRNASRGRKWAMLKFGLNATFQKHSSVAAARFFNPTSYALDHVTNGRSYAVRFEIQPMSSEVVASGSTNSLASDLRSRYAEGPVVYAFGARFFADEDETPIDDPSVPWPTAFVKLGTLAVSAARDSEQARIATQSYNPGQVAPRIRSLSTINDVRNVVYDASAQLRLGD